MRSDSSSKISQSESVSEEISLSASQSNSPISQSESVSNSVSMSESSSNSISMSKSQSSSTSTTTSTTSTNSTNNNGATSTPNNRGTQSTFTNTLKPEHENTESVDKTVKRHHRRGKLSQTGTESSSNLLGVMIAALGGLLGFRRKNRKDKD